MLLLPAEAFQKSGGSRMYTFEPPILYSEDALRGAFSGQHPLHFRFALAFSRRGAIRFLLWWLYLHRRLRSRQRGPFLSDRSDFSTFQDDHFHQASTVFIRPNHVAFRLRKPKPFGFDSGRPRQWLSAPSVCERCVTTSVPPPGAGQNARKQSRL